MLEQIIDEGAIAYNVRHFKALVGPDVSLMCVVKADAYGHGAQHLVPVMEAAGADAFGVATLAEARKLKATKLKTTKPVLAWIWEPEEDIPPGIDLAVSNLRQVRRLVERQVPVRVYAKVETGMHRAGLEESEWHDAFAALRDATHIEVLGLMSHLACADEPDNPFTDAQAEVFRRAIATARALGLSCPVNHLANTAATLTRKDLHFQQVRVGLGCYGLEPIDGLDHGLRPAMAWAGTITAVKPIAAGQGTSYGLTFTAPGDGFLANVPAGYADGLPRAFQSRFRVGIGGKLYPQVGRICMDQFMVDLGTNPAGVAPGDTAVIFGLGGMSATELATAVGTINYEVLCRPTGRTIRTFKGSTDA